MIQRAPSVQAAPTIGLGDTCPRPRRDARRARDIPSVTLRPSRLLRGTDAGPAPRPPSRRDRRGANPKPVGSGRAPHTLGAPEIAPRNGCRVSRVPPAGSERRTRPGIDRRSPNRSDEIRVAPPGADRTGVAGPRPTLRCPPGDVGSIGTAHPPPEAPVLPRHAPRARSALRQGRSARLREPQGPRRRISPASGPRARPERNRAKSARRHARNEHAPGSSHNRDTAPQETRR